MKNIKRPAFNTLAFQLRLTLPRLVFRPLSFEEALLNPWRGPSIDELVIAHYEEAHEYLENTQSTLHNLKYEEFCQKMDEQAELRPEDRDESFNVFEYFDYVDLCKASGRNKHYTFREFFAIRYYVRKQRHIYPHIKMVMRLAIIAIIALVIIYVKVWAPRVPDAEDVRNGGYVREYINLQVGSDIPFDAFEHSGGYRISSLTSVRKYVLDYYPDTLKSGIYRLKDWDEEVKGRNIWHRRGEEVYFDEEFKFISVPVLIKNEDYLAGRWRDANKGANADSQMFSRYGDLYYPA
jgi:hypothetical protein